MLTQFTRPRGTEVVRSMYDVIKFDFAVCILRNLLYYNTTAFDIAGKGIADPTNMLEAIIVAASISGDGVLPNKIHQPVLQKSSSLT